MMTLYKILFLCFSREKATPLTQTQISANTTTANKVGNDVGKRLFESGTYKDPRLIYDVSKSLFCLHSILIFLYTHFALYRDQDKMRKRNNLLKHLCDKKNKKQHHTLKLCAIDMFLFLICDICIYLKYSDDYLPSEKEEYSITENDSLYFLFFNLGVGRFKLI